MLEELVSSLRSHGIELRKKENSKVLKAKEGLEGSEFDEHSEDSEDEEL